MKTIRPALLLVVSAIVGLAAVVSEAQTPGVTVNATLVDGQGKTQKSAYLHWELYNCGDNVPQVQGGTNYSVVASQFDMHADPQSGLISGSVFGGDQILCGGVNSTQWLVTQYKASGQISGVPQYYCLTSGQAFNPATAQPCVDPPPPPGFFVIFSNPIANQKITQPTGTSMTFNGSFMLPKGIFLGPVTFSQLPSLVGLTNVVYVSDGTAGSSPCTGGGTGSFAFYQASGWTCGLGGGGGGTISGSGTPSTLTEFSGVTAVGSAPIVDSGSGLLTVNDALTVSGAATLNSTLNVSGATTESGLTVTGTAAISALTVGASATLPILGATQCLHVNSAGVIAGTGADCGSGGGGGNVTGPGSSGVGNFALFNNTSGSLLSQSVLQDSAGTITSTEPVSVTPSSGLASFLGDSVFTGTLCNAGSNGLITLPPCYGAQFFSAAPAGATGSSVGVFGLSSPVTNLTGNPNLIGAYDEGLLNANGSPNFVTGGVGLGKVSGVSGTVANLTGESGVAYDLSSGQNVTLLAGIDGQVQVNASGGTATTGVALYARSPVLTSALAHNYGLYLADQTGGGANNPDPWGIYEIAGKNYFGGATTFNSTTLFNGEVSTVASTTTNAGLNLPPGAAPTAPNNGDLWTTSAGMFARIAGATVGPFGNGLATGAQYQSLYFTATNTPGAYGPGLTGQISVSQGASAAPTFSSPGIAGRIVTTGTTDTILCDSSTTIQDRGKRVVYATGGTVTVTIPDAGSAGCSGFMAFAVATQSITGSSASTTVTFNRTSTSTFNIVNGSTNLAGQTTFNLTASQFATIASLDNANWFVFINAAGGGGGGSGTVSPNNTVAGALPFYAAAGGSTTVTPDANLVDASGVLTAAEPLILPAGTASVPTLQFSTGTGSGFHNSSQFKPCYAVGGIDVGCIGDSFFEASETGSFILSQTNLADGAPGVELGAVGTGATMMLHASTPILLPQCKVTSAVTLSGTPATICTWSLPNSAQVWAWQCSGDYSISAGTSPAFILGMNASQSPTSETGRANIWTTLAGTNTQSSVTATSSGNQQILTGGAVTTVTNAQWTSSGTIQASATAGTFSITATLAGTSTPAGTVNVGSTCQLY